MMRLTADVGTPDSAPADGPELPDYRIHAVDVPSPGTVTVQGDLVLDGFLRDAVHTLRPIGSDGTSPGPPGIVLQVGDRPRRAPTDADDAFLDDVLTTQADLVRIYLPPDVNCLLTVVDRCLRSGDHLNLVVAGKERLPQWLTVAEAEVHCAAGIGTWGWAGNANDGDPDVVLACCGDTATLEVMAAASILLEHLPALRIRVVNVVDLMTLQPEADHPHGLPDVEYDALFTVDRPVVFAFHGRPWVVHRLCHRRANRRLHVCGRLEDGPVTTPFDGRVRNRWDRFHLVQDVVDRLPELGGAGVRLRHVMTDSLLAHAAFITRYGLDLPEVGEWTWSRP